MCVPCDGIYSPSPTIASIHLFYTHHKSSDLLSSPSHPLIDYILLNESSRRNSHIRYIPSLNHQTHPKLPPPPQGPLHPPVPAQTQTIDHRQRVLHRTHPPRKIAD